MLKKGDLIVAKDKGSDFGYQKVLVTGFSPDRNTVWGMGFIKNVMHPVDVPIDDIVRVVTVDSDESYPDTTRMKQFLTADVRSLYGPQAVI